MVWRKAIANKKLRESGMLPEKYKDWRIVAVDNDTYTLVMGEEQVKIGKIS